MLLTTFHLNKQNKPTLTIVQMRFRKKHQRQLHKNRLFQNILVCKIHTPNTIKILLVQ